MSIVEVVRKSVTTVEVAHPGVQGPPGSGGSGGAVDSVNGRTGAVVLTKSDIGLANVDNTADASKPVSTAQAAADAAVLASANATTAAHAARTDNPHTVTAAQLGLGNVENKSSATIRGEITSGNVTAALGYTPENAAQKGAAGGYAPLDGTGKVASTYLPSYVDDVLEFANLAGFPVTGETGKMYVALDTNKVYRWSGSAYVEISGSPGSTDAVPEGASNLYFTAARVLATAHTHPSTDISDSTTTGRAVLTAANAAAARAALDVLALDGSSEMRGVVQWRQQTSGDFYPVTYAAQKNYAGDIIRSATIGQWASGAVVYAQDTLALAPNRSYAWEYCIGGTRIAAVTAGTDSAGNVSGSEISAQILRVRTAGGTEGMRLRSTSNAVKVDVFDAANQYTGDVLEISTVLNSRTVRLYGPVILAAYTVAALPLAPPEGATAYATNGRKSGEGAGAGTGVPVYYSAGKWRVYRDDSEVQA